MGNSISNKTTADKYKINNQNTDNQNTNNQNTDNQNSIETHKNSTFTDFDSIELKQYNYNNQNHKPPFPNEYFSKFIIPKEYICEKTNKPFYIFMSEIIGFKIAKNLIDITESYNMCYI